MLLIHLSDIHFRRNEVGSAMDPNSHLRNLLVIDAEGMCKKLKKSATAILISGDIAFSAHPTEYEFAVEWLNTLATRCGTTLASVFIVPGNHDVDRTQASSPAISPYHAEIKSASPITVDSVMKGLLEDVRAGKMLYESLVNYNLFAAQFFCALTTPERTIAKRDLTLNDGSVLRLNGLNSAFVSSKADKKGDLFVDPACFQITHEPGVEHLIMCHHPYEWLRNGNQLRDHLNDVCKIQLFGHEHTNRIEMTDDYVLIAAGATHPERDVVGWEPGYNLIELEIIEESATRVLHVQTHIRIWQSNPGTFVPKLTRRQKKDVFSKRILLESWLSADETSLKNGAFTKVGPTQCLPGLDPTVAESPSMNNLRDISIRFFRLTLNQRAEIAGKLKLLDTMDINEPDFERYRSVLLRAHKRNLMNELDSEIIAAQKQNN